MRKDIKLRISNFTKKGRKILSYFDLIILANRNYSFFSKSNHVPKIKAVPIAIANIISEFSFALINWHEECLHDCIRIILFVCLWSDEPIGKRTKLLVS